MIEKIYTNADGKNVAKYIIYAEIDTTTGQLKNRCFAYADPELTKPLNSDELKKCFFTGPGLIVRGILANKEPKEFYGYNVLVVGFFDRDYNTSSRNYSVLLCADVSGKNIVPINLYGSEYKPNEVG